MSPVPYMVDLFVRNAVAYARREGVALERLLRHVETAWSAAAHPTETEEGGDERTATDAAPPACILAAPRDVATGISRGD